ncbi:CRISPR system precrRNA processing endoribonuclease RAMP protein Cas6 [Acinetobacter sichuanensis]|uniref:CRISPR system precrRNA processing endoribonuclease RAMP protein Cas6 n=1 Tax=Acinetobacter sichuanensis TaxID=2136183 RepID=A0A371YPM9_9GAMM|nr:CRISPR system precrRNA processing endoribonuclease RAMP protein Cas6 [Acinetobacter sichuanensis]RFC83431.1 CRISPR system precrRNA processing endoribonuclease RAMP protein Cas6 [Acinetobacter sichuanensis]
MSNFPISRYTIKFQALENIQLPKYAGSTLRGAFGHALKSMACLTASRNKGTCCCEPAERCLYRQLFDPPKKKLDYQNRVQDIAPPFVIEAYALPEQIAKGAVATFHIVLIGNFAHQQQMMIQLAWQRALAEGIGQNLSKGGEQSKLISFGLCDQPKPNIQTATTIRLHLFTHARLQYRGNFVDVEHFSPFHFLHALVRRYLFLIETYSDVTLNQEDIAQLYDEIAKIKGYHQLEWINWSRYSSRQKQKMNLDGLMGSITLENLSPRLYYYLYLGQWLHVGKGCVFGLGQYTLQDIQAKTKFEKISA